MAESDCAPYVGCDPSIAKNFPTVTAPNYYGNGQTDSFKCAITGSTSLSSLQESERADLIPEKLSNRFSLRISGNASSESISSFKNESYYDPALENGSISTKQVKTASNNIELAAGYTWTDFAIELEWLAVKSITVNANITGISPNLAFSSVVKGDSLIGNIYWIFDNRYNVKLYALMCAGVSNNTSTNTLSNASATVVKRISPAFGVGTGITFNVVSKLFADMKVRYLYLGKVTMQASNGTGNYMVLKAVRSWIGVSAGLVWLI